MTKHLQELALRKALLQVRSALCRLEMRQELHAIVANVPRVQMGLPLAVTKLAGATLLAPILRRLTCRKELRALAVASGIWVLVNLANRYLSR